MYRYYVTGPGQFPDDMLRYDNGKVVKTIDRDDFKDRKFYLIESKFPATIGRWQSFLWVVIQTPEQCIRFSLPLPD